MSEPDAGKALGTIAGHGKRVPSKKANSKGPVASKRIESLLDTQMASERIKSQNRGKKSPGSLETIMGTSSPSPGSTGNGRQRSRIQAGKASLVSEMTELFQDKIWKEQHKKPRRVGGLSRKAQEIKDESEATKVGKAVRSLQFLAHTAACTHAA